MHDDFEKAIRLLRLALLAKTTATISVGKVYAEIDWFVSQHPGIGLLPVDESKPVEAAEMIFNKLGTGGVYHYEAPINTRGC